MEHFCQVFAKGKEIPMLLIRASKSLVSLLTCGSALLAHPTLACGPMVLCKPKLSFAAGAQLPANTQAIPMMVPKPYQPPFDMLVPQLYADGQLQTTDLVDDAVAGWKLLKPVKGLKAGTTYLLHLPGFCPDLESATGALLPAEDVTFTAGPEAPVPATLGALALNTLAPSMVAVWTQSGSCTVPILAARGQVGVKANPELLPWQALTRAELWVDGALWVRSDYADVPLLGTLPLPTSIGRTVHEFHVPCGNVPPMDDAGVKAGPHHVDVRMHVAGAYNDAPYLYGDLVVTCDAAPQEDAASSADADAAGDATGTFAEPAAEGAAAPARGAGCAATGRAGGGGGWFALGAAAMLWTRRRLSRRGAYA
jgi:hypothetical protein